MPREYPFVLTGEDGLTLYAFRFWARNQSLFTDMGFETVENVWFRPSFGRGAGVRTENCEKGFSGFGESDVLVIGRANNNRRRAVFVECKRGTINQNSKSFKEIKYQLLLKLALMLANNGHHDLEMGQRGQRGNYCWVDYSGSKFGERNTCNLMDIGDILKKYYDEICTNRTGENKRPRKNGWLLKQDSPDAPAVSSLIGAEEIGLYAIFFNEQGEREFSLNESARHTLFTRGEFESINSDHKLFVKDKFGWDINGGDDFKITIRSISCPKTIMA